MKRNPSYPEIVPQSNGKWKGRSFLRLENSEKTADGNATAAAAIAGPEMVYK
ncbi:hypothetical protein SRHO_G00235110 [Serrasalmus rhombeus]